MASPGATDFYSSERFRRNTYFFAFGRMLNAGLNFGIFALIASKMPIQEFGLYAWLLAFIQISIGLTHFGVDHVAGRYVPFYRTRLDPAALRPFVLRLVAFRIALLLAFGSGFFVATPYLLAIFGQEEWSFPFKLFLLVFITMGITDLLRSFVFGPLLKQLPIQVNLFVRSSVFISLLLYFEYSDGLSIYSVIYSEIAATALAALLGVIQLAYILKDRSTASGATLEKNPNWRKLVGFAANNYASDVLQWSGSGQAMILLGNRLLSLSSLAEFAFAYRFSVQLERLLPGNLFMGLIRAKLFARYSQERSFEKLKLRTILILKISNCILAAGAAVLIVYGRPILEAISDGNYADSHGLLLVLVVLMAIQTQKRVFVLVVNALERPIILRRASLALLLVLPTAVIFMFMGAGSMGFAAAMVVGELIFVVAVLWQLRREGYAFAFDCRGLARIGVSMLSAVLIGFSLVELLPMGTTWEVVGIVAIFIVFAVSVRLLRTFNVHERHMLEGLVGRRIYVL